MRINESAHAGGSSAATVAVAERKPPSSWLLWWRLTIDIFCRASLIDFTSNCQLYFTPTWIQFRLNFLSLSLTLSLSLSSCLSLLSYVFISFQFYFQVNLNQYWIFHRMVFVNLEHICIRIISEMIANSRFTPFFLFFFPFFSISFRESYRNSFWRNCCQAWFWRWLFAGWLHFIQSD